jgi:exosortase E/protease (VPEID-CTERM system)
MRTAWGFGLLALLVAEAALAVWTINLAALAEQHAWLATILDPSKGYLYRGIVAAIGIILLGTAWLRYGAVRSQIELRPAFWGWPFLLGHLAAFAATVLLLSWLTEGRPPFAPPGIWFLAAMALSFLSLLCWWAALFPARLWLPLGWRGLAVVCLGTAVGLAAWRVGEISEDLWQPLARWTLWVVYGLLHLFCRQPVCEPENVAVGTPTFTVGIADSCSGYQGIGLICVFLGTYLWLFRSSLRFPHAWLLLPVGILLAWFSNAIRLTALILIGTWGSREVALGGFHSHAGWMAFLVVSLGLVTLASRLRYFTQDDSPRAALPADNPTAAYLVPLLALLATIMVTAAFTSGFDQYYPLRILVVVAALWTYRRYYTGFRWGRSWLALALGTAVFALWLALEIFRPPHPQDATFLQEFKSHTWLSQMMWLVCRVVGSVVTVPLAEELAFRGYLTRRLIAADFQTMPLGRFSWLSFLLSSVAFGVLHGDRWFAGVLAGMAYALALYRRGSLGDAIVAHATSNALIAVYVLATGSWSLWS